MLAADECSRQGLLLPLPSEEARRRLHDRFLPFYALGNPIDLTGQVQDHEYLETLNELKDEYDGFLVIAHTGVAGITPRLAEILAEFRATCTKPLVAHLAKGGISAKLAGRCERAGIPVYTSPERGVRGLRALIQDERFL